MAWKSLLAIGLVPVVLQLATSGNYGIFRDELYYLACAKRLAWGYVDHPPFSIAVLRFWTGLFGESTESIRVLPALMGGMLPSLSGLIAWRLGGGPAAQRIAALGVGIAPLLLGINGFFSMNAFDLLLWSVLFLILCVFLERPRPVLWLAVGLIAGVGLLNKLSMGVWGVALVGALVLGPHRRQFARWELWFGGVLAVLIFLPHLLWQHDHNWPTREFLENAATDKNLHRSLPAYLGGLIIELHLLNAPLWIAGLIWLLAAPAGRQFRLLGIMAVLVIGIFYIQGGKVYYAAPLMPMLIAAGSLPVGKAMRRWGGRWAEPAVLVLLAAGGAMTMPLAVPVLPPEELVAYQERLGLRAVQEEKNAIAELDQHFADRFGWKELAESVRDVVSKLPESERAKALILTRNYGEAGALEYFGKEPKLPRTASGHNNYALWGYGEKPQIVIAVGISPKFLEMNFADITVGGRHDAMWALPDERDYDIYVCREPLRDFDDIWSDLRRFI